GGRLPEADFVIIAPGCQRAAVRRERHGDESLLRSVIAKKRLAAWHLPKPNRVVAQAPCCQRLTIRADCQAGHIVHAGLESTNLLPCSHVPEGHEGSVPGSQYLAIAWHCQVCPRILAPAPKRECPDDLPGVHVPDAGRAIAPAGHQDLAIGREDERSNAVLLTSQRTDLPSCGHVPEMNVRPIAPGGQDPAIG